MGSGRFPMAQSNAAWDAPAASFLAGPIWKKRIPGQLCQPSRRAGPTVPGPDGHSIAASPAGATGRAVRKPLRPPSLLAGRRWPSAKCRQTVGEHQRTVLPPGRPVRYNRHNPSVRETSRLCPRRPAPRALDMHGLRPTTMRGSGWVERHCCLALPAYGAHRWVIDLNRQQEGCLHES